MNIRIHENQYHTILEAFYKKKSDPVAEHIRKSIKDVYYGSRFWGTAPKVEDNCMTEEGVIGIYEHEPGQDTWSIINRFDTNTKVRDQMKEWFKQENPNLDLTDNNLMNWISERKLDLFKGKWTSKLVELNEQTVKWGNENEKRAVEVLQNYFGGSADIKRFCAGDVRDTKKGMDLAVKVGNENYYVQVKPFKSVKSYIDEFEGDTFFQVESSLDPTKYSEKNVQIFFFLNYQENEYIAFSNEKRKIKYSSPYTNFFEPYLITNIKFPKKTPKRFSQINIDKHEKVKDLFKTSERKIENLKYKRDALDALIKKELEKIEKMNVKKSPKKF
jgi:hypothetical protein